VNAGLVVADTRPVDENGRDAIREELAALEAREARVSAERRRLHQQIDSGFASDSTRAREQEVSEQRRTLHQRIDSLQDLLGMERTSTVLARKGASPAIRELDPDLEPERPEYLSATTPPVITEGGTVAHF
jgi:hypothetical protein